MVPLAVCLGAINMYASPLILNSSVDSGGLYATDSVNDTKVNTDPDPISVAGVVDSVALPDILKSPVVSCRLVEDSVVLENPNSDPDPV